MKNPPTLADALIAFSCKKGIHPILVKTCRAMLSARKFVIAESMVRLWADMEVLFARKGGLKRQINILNATRLQSRLPHRLTWIEHDPRAYRDQTVKQHGFVVKPGLTTMMRKGWLLEQHPSLPTAFRCTEYDAHEDMDDLRIGLIGFAWCADDSTVVPWPQYQHPVAWRSSMHATRTLEAVDMGESDPAYEWSDSELLSGTGGYFTKQVHLIDAAHPALRKRFERTRPDLYDPGFVWRHRAQARALWLLLATINDIPITVEHIEPSKGYVARGSYKRFLEHSVVHLNVPETRWRKVAATVLQALRRRRHDVRGHWREDWRNPLSRLCDPHVFDASDNFLMCKKCGGRKFHIPEHSRGDATLGYVTHDYSVTHEEPAR